MTIVLNRQVQRLVFQSQTTPGITFTTVVGGTSGASVPSARLLPTPIGSPGQIPAVNDDGTGTEWVDQNEGGGAVSDPFVTASETGFIPTYADTSLTGSFGTLSGYTGTPEFPDVELTEGAGASRIAWTVPDGAVGVILDITTESPASALLVLVVGSDGTPVLGGIRNYPTGGVSNPVSGRIVAGLSGSMAHDRRLTLLLAAPADDLQLIIVSLNAPEIIADAYWKYAESGVYDILDADIKELDTTVTAQLAAVEATLATKAGPAIFFADYSPFTNVDLEGYASEFEGDGGENEDILFLFNQTDPAESGLYQFDASVPEFVRMTAQPTGPAIVSLKIGGYPGQGLERDVLYMIHSISDNGGYNLEQLLPNPLTTWAERYFGTPDEVIDFSDSFQDWLLDATDNNGLLRFPGPPSGAGAGVPNVARRQFTLVRKDTSANTVTLVEADGVTPLSIIGLPDSQVPSGGAVTFGSDGSYWIAKSVTRPA